jgi:hypothetical protein
LRYWILLGPFIYKKFNALFRICAKSHGDYSEPPGFQSLKRKVLVLVWVGEIWNVLEAAVALWRLQSAWRDENDESAAERKAHKLVGITFFVFAGYIFIQSVATLLGYFPQSEETRVGLILIVASAVVWQFFIQEEVNRPETLFALSYGGSEGDAGM